MQTHNQNKNIKNQKYLIELQEMPNLILYYQVKINQPILNKNRRQKEK